MIPHTLQLKNFLSYGPEEQTINFTPHHLICLSGKNGHGKSALLDAITWAIWGQARKTIGTSKADDGLMHLGQKYMFVRLDFEINNQMYRIRREYIKTKSKPLAILDFGVLKEEDSISPLTDKTIKLTQAKIEKTIGLTYESFASSAFLKQGESNAFSKKTPRERKEVLATILNLDQFESLKKSALEKAKTVHQQHQNHLYIIEKIHEELETLTSIEQETKTVKQNIKSIEEKEKKQIKLIQKQQEFFIALEKKKQEKQFLDQEQQKLTLELTTIEEKITATKKIIETSNNTDKTKLLASLEKEKAHYTKLVEHIHAQAKEEIKQKESYFALKENIQKIAHQKESQAKQITQLKESVTSYQKEHTAITKEQQKIDQKITALQQTEASIKKRVLQAKELDESHQKQTQKYNFLYAQGAGAQQHIEELEKQIKHAKTKSDICLFCKQTVDQTQQDEIIDRLEQDKKVAHEKREVAKQTIAKVQEQIKLIRAEQSNLQAEQNKLETIEFQLKEYQKQSNLFKKKTEEITEQIKNKQSEVAQLEKESAQLQTKAEMQSLKNFETSIIAIQKERKNYQEYQDKLSTLDKEIKQYHALQEKKLEHKQIQKELEHQVQQQKLLIKKIKANADSLKQYETIEEQEKTTLQEKITQQQAHQEIQKQKNHLLTEKGSLETKLERHKTLHKNLKHYESITSKLQREVDDYQAIAKALGKDGIQALLIEEALPEIEQEANKLLARLTNNQTQIFIESLRDLKKGGNKETLDIKIADNMGIRPYEMFSGGEAFRIDFALRIAISKLVARHAGTSLQTIFIDEGFGSQDEEGLQLIMDSIYKIQNDFAMVIIVSHLPALKEQFPVQFLINKKPSGTRVTVVEQG